MFRYLKILYYLFYRPKIFFPRRNYSMHDEDIFLMEYFRSKNNGFYIDVGCYHPFEGNNTQCLYKKGWSGMNIDISELSILLFNFARKRDINIFSGISNKEEKLEMFYRKEINMLNTLDEKIAKIHFKNGYLSKSIRSNTLNFFLEKNNINSKIDFLNIDVEGKELEVLESFSIEKFNPTLICIEIHNKEKMYDESLLYLKNNEVYNYLLKHKYKIVWNKKYSFIFEKTV